MGRSAVGDRARDLSRMLIGRRGGSVHHAASTNRAMIAGTRFSILFQDGEVPTTKPPLDNECSGTTVACYGVEWRAVVGEKSQPI